MLAFFYYFLAGLCFIGTLYFGNKGWDATKMSNSKERGPKMPSESNPWVAKIDASGNSGNFQMNLNSPGSKQIINKKRVIVMPHVKQGKNLLEQALCLPHRQAG